ncbi:MAG TPA: glycosyltransferase WbuB, partial [candidate division Zixibacteria bacterium]|nr:glycosyltransferase WbuB [candidate division Zixibacteria bacterium]
VDNYTVIHSWHTLSAESTLISRFLENISFAISSSWRILQQPPADVVYLFNWPIFAQGMNSWVLKKLISKNVKIVNNVRDVYPESLMGKNMLKADSLIARLLRKWDKSHLHRCDVVITLAPTMKDLLVKNREVPSEKVKVLPNWFDAGKFRKKLPKDGAFRKKHNISPDTFLAIYAGSMTMSAGLDLYVQAAELLKDSGKIQFLLVGDGSERKPIENKIARKGLKNIRNIYPMNPEDVPEVQAAADVLLMSLSGEMAQNAAPSKQVSYMFSGRPVIASISPNGTPAKIIADSKAGYVLPPDNPQALADKLIELSENNQDLEEIGENARKYAMKNFAKDMVLPKMIDIFEALADNA